MADIDNDPFGLDDFNDDSSFDDSDNPSSNEADSFDSSDSFEDFKFDDTSFDDFDNSEMGNEASKSYSNLEDNIGGLNMDIDDVDGGYTDKPKDISESKKIMKTSLIAIGAGLVIILIGFGINRAVKSNHNNAKEVVESQTVTETQTPNVIEANTVTEGSKWIEFNGDISIDNGVEIESSFTVTSIKHYAMVTNGESDKQLKSIITGNISGLIGTYELEIPFELAQNLEYGSVFKVTYKLATNNGYSVVSGIKY